MPDLSQAQYEYLATLNYNNLALNRIGNIPGVTYVIDKSTYDQNHQRLFFQGGSHTTGPFNLYTINAINGAIIYNTNCPAGSAGGNIFGIEYDQATDTLYALYNAVNNTVYFTWIDPSNGIVHIINNLTLAGFRGYSNSTFDTKNHQYIVNSPYNLLVIDASTGIVLNNFPDAYLTDIKYDNVSGRLYGINYSGSLPNLQFDSVSLTTGTVYAISTLPIPNDRFFGIPQVSAYAIDENAGKYIFLAEHSNSAGCIFGTLYTLDIKTGSILTAISYPYDPSAILDVEMVILYSFDNKRGTLYALNWNPPDSLPLVIITASPDIYCAGSLLTFTAVPAIGIANPSYQWKINGVNVGTNSPTYARSNLSSGDSVRCIMTNNPTCGMPTNDTSNSIPINFQTSVQASVSIAASATALCINQPDTFTAHAINTGTTPTYQWILNGTAAGANDSVFTSSSLANGDSLICIIVPGSACVLPGPDSSNTIVVQVNSVSASLTIASAATTICSGDTALFTASPVNGGNAPAYQWLVNGTATGTNSDTLSTSSLMNGDIVNCLMTSSIGCAIPVPSADSITMTVNPVPAIRFDTDTLVIKPGESVTLTPIVDGQVTGYLWSPSTFLSNQNIMSPVAEPAVTTTYQLTATGNDGCSATGKETVIVYVPLEMPGAFTPNGDSHNDLFRIPPSTPQRTISFAVYNRWGQIIFLTKNSSAGWDGNFQNKPQPSGAYVWQIEYTDLLTGRNKIAKGTVLLIR